MGKWGLHLRRLLAYEKSLVGLHARWHTIKKYQRNGCRPVTRRQVVYLPGFSYYILLASRCSLQSLAIDIHLLSLHRDHPSDSLQRGAIRLGAQIVRTGSPQIPQVPVVSDVRPHRRLCIAGGCLHALDIHRGCNVQSGILAVCVWRDEAKISMLIAPPARSVALAVPVFLLAAYLEHSLHSTLSIRYFGKSQAKTWKTKSARLLRRCIGFLWRSQLWSCFTAAFYIVLNIIIMASVLFFDILVRETEPRDAVSRHQET